jgi:hypothetical protein
MRSEDEDGFIAFDDKRNDLDQILEALRYRLHLVCRGQIGRIEMILGI